MKRLIDRLGHDDRGFTLVEVVVAISIVGLLGVSAAYISIAGTQASGSQQRANLATTVAVQAMEDILSRQAQIDASTGVTALVGGRAAAAVDGLWATYSDSDMTADMYELSDPTAGPTSVPSVPLISASSLDSTDYSVATLIGSCYRAATGGECARIDGIGNRPATPPAGMFETLRVGVIVEWTAGAACADVPCRYELVTMIDVNGDVEWITNG